MFTNDNGWVLGEAMQLVLKDNLPFTSVVIGHNDFLVGSGAIINLKKMQIQFEL
jgi:hypothetical protein